MEAPTSRTISTELVAALILVAAVCTACERGGERTAQAQSPGDESNGPGTAVESPESDDRYTTRAEPGSIAVADESDVRMSIIASDGLKVNREYPAWKLKLKPPEGVEVQPTSFERDAFELDGERATVRAKLEASRTGTHAIPGTASFSVCNDEKCHTLRDVSVEFRIEAVESSGGGETTHGD